MPSDSSDADEETSSPNEKSPDETTDPAPLRMAKAALRAMLSGRSDSDRSD